MRTTITQEGQRYVDDPVYVEVSKARRLAMAVNTALLTLRTNTNIREPREVTFALHALYDGTADYDQQQVALRWMLREPEKTAPRGPKIDPIIMALSHHERVLLRWMVPDGSGGLKPKYAGR